MRASTVSGSCARMLPTSWVSRLPAPPPSPEMNTICGTARHSRAQHITGRRERESERERGGGGVKPCREVGRWVLGAKHLAPRAFVLLEEFGKCTPYCTATFIGVFVLCSRARERGRKSYQLNKVARTTRRHSKNTLPRCLASAERVVPPASTVLPEAATPGVVVRANLGLPPTRQRRCIHAVSTLSVLARGAAISLAISGSLSTMDCTIAAFPKCWKESPLSSRTWPGGRGKRSMVTLW